MLTLSPDRFATLYLAAPLARIVGAKAEPSLAVLMYHSVTSDAPACRVPYYDLVTDPPGFMRQMEHLHSSGCHVVDLAAGFEKLRGGNHSGRMVAITFDDGFRDFYEHAFPALQRYGLTATVFLPTAFIGNTRRMFKERPCLTWSEIAELARHGIAFGSHTVTHRKTAALTQHELRSELLDSKAAIEEKLGSAVTTFACPYAFPQSDAGFVQRYRSLMSEAGYTVGVTTQIGRVREADDPFMLRRLPISRQDDSRLLEAKLCGAYDWLAWIQTGSQQWKRLSRRGNRAPVVNQPSIELATH